MRGEVVARDRGRHDAGGEALDDLGVGIDDRALEVGVVCRKGRSVVELDRTAERPR